MKKVLVSLIMIFSLSQAQYVWAFSEEVLNESIEEYLSFFDEESKESPQEEKKEISKEAILKAKTEMFEKQLILSRKAQALSYAVVDIGNDVYNLFLLNLMKRYMEEADHREALQLLIDELIRVVQPEIEARENHRVWKSAIQGGADGFYVLATLEVLNAVGKKTKAFERLSNLMQKIHAGQPASVVISETTEIVVSGGAAGGVNLPVRVGEVAAKATARGSFLKGLLSFRPSPVQVERWLGKPGIGRMGRAVAVGILLGMLYDGYKYHWTEQKLNPSLLFEMVQTLAILDLAARVIEFRESISSQPSPMSFDERDKFLESHKATQQLLESEFKQFEIAVPQFLANISVDVAEFEEHPLKLFLDSFYEENPKVKEALIKKEVSAVSLSPIELMLEDSAILLHRFEEKMMRDVLSPPSPENH
ncbi:MAG: hypothetical protein HYY62_02805 [Deltaproteobacteria bacterium]|nr:hypothetical protein [Deltaproteobacteria bacterium]